jgi:hypothetical protein
MEDFADFKKYRWFFTSSKKLVIGGKNSIQNDELLKRIKSLSEDLFIMHTQSPGSPFSVILANKDEVEKKDLNECAIFTACFSKAWKSELKETTVHLFNSNDLFKSRGMKSGTWGVKSNVKELNVPPHLVLTKQEEILRAVPEVTVKSKRDILLRISPGKVDKVNLLPEIIKILGKQFTKDEILAALPAGGIKLN